VRGIKAFARREGLMWYQRPDVQYEAPLTIYTGRRRQGKTLLTARDTVVALRQGLRVGSSTRLVDRATGRSTEPLVNWVSILRFMVECVEERTPGLVVMDELHMKLHSRLWARGKGENDWVLGLMAQWGHFGVGLLGNAHSLDRMDVIVRELVDVEIKVEKLMPQIPFVRRRLPILRTLSVDPLEKLEAEEVEDLQGKVKKRPPRGHLVFVPWWAFAAYNTRELVPFSGFDAIGDADEVPELFERAQRAILAQYGEVVCFSDV
jgi:hypothetical protein